MAWQGANHVEEDIDAEADADYERIMADEFRRMDASPEAKA